MNLRLKPGLRYLAVLPIAIAALWIADYLGIDIPNQPGVLLLAVVYCAYRGGLWVGLVGAAMHILYTAVFFSTPDALFAYNHANMVRAVVISLVAPAMATMVGLLRQDADQLLTRAKLSEAKLTKLNAELEARVAARTTEAVLARDLAERANEVKSMFLANVSHCVRRSTPATAKLALLVSQPPDVPMLHADQRKLKQVLLNLLSNAIKLTRPGGRVELTVTVTSEGINFSVVDSGIGIPTAYLDRVPLPFIQVDNSFSRPHQGTGLGLPLVKAIAELHGGRLQLTSQEGIGTTASVMLPAERLAPPHPIAAPLSRTATA